MSVHEHVLDPVRHAAFLARGLVDPFSGVPFRPPSAVVFCAACGTPLLRETWQALGGTHCGQSDTLPDVPGARTADGLVAPRRPAPPVAPPVSPPAEVASAALSTSRAAYQPPLLLTLPEQPTPPAPPPAPTRETAPAMVARPRVSPPPLSSEGMPLLGPSIALQQASRPRPGRRVWIAVPVLAAVVAVAWFGWRWSAREAPAPPPPPAAADSSQVDLATPIEAGVVTGFITGADPQDAEGRPFETFAFESDGTPATVRLTAVFASRLGIAGPDGQPVSVRVDSASGEAVAVLPGVAGRFTLTVAPERAEDRGAFELRIEAGAGEQPIALDEQVSGTLGGTPVDGRYRHRYLLDAVAGQTLTIALDAGFVPGVEVEGPGGPLLMRGGLGDQVVQFTPQQSGPHMVEVSAAADAPAGVFRMVVSAGGGVPQIGSETSEGAAQDILEAPAPQASSGPPAVRPSAPSRPSAPQRQPVARAAPQRPSAAPSARPAVAPVPRGRAAEGASAARPRRGRPAQVVEVVGAARAPLDAPPPWTEGFSGTGRYRVVVAGNGDVLNVEVVEPSGNPVADAEALRTLRTWRFARGARPEVAVVTLAFAR